MWKIPEEYFYTTWEYFSIKEVNYLLLFTCILFSTSGLGYIFFEKRLYLPIYSLSLISIVSLNGLYFHHDIFTVACLFLLMYFEDNFNFNIVNSFAASVMVMATIAKLNPSFLSGETIGEMIPINDERILIIMAVCAVIFEFALALYYWGLITNKLCRLGFIFFHYFMGLILMRGLVFNALFVFLIERQRLDKRSKWDLSKYPYLSIYFGISFFTILFKIVYSQL